MSEATGSRPEDHLPLTPAVSHIMLSLAEGDKHGYAIMREVEEMTDGHLTMGPGTLYGSIKRMLGAGLVEETDPPPADEDESERRRYYRLTGLGEKVLSAEMARLDAMVRAAAARKVVWKPGPQAAG
jgi:DNA-binding PadR family transcriptional regulator